MPVYNAVQFLNKTILSVVNQTLNDVEIICVDDGSTDKSVEKLKNLKNKYGLIEIFSQENQGSGKARNTGIDKANGEYIAFLDADDIFLNKYVLEIMYNFAKENNADVVSANLQFVEKNYKLKENWHYHNKDYAYFSSYGFISPKDYGIPFAFYKNIFKREFLLKNNIKFPDLIRGQDPVFLAEVLSNTNKIYTVPLNFYGYNYSIGGGVNVKVNTYEKKYSYMKHFKVTCDVLEKGKLIDCANVYKTHLLSYLTWRDNIYDFELYEIYEKLFKDLKNYFDKDNNEYIKFKILSTTYNLLKKDTENYFQIVKKEFVNLNYIENDIASEKLGLILGSNSLIEFKQKYFDNPIEEWETKNKLIIPKSENKPLKNIENSPISQNKEKINRNKIKINENRELIKNGEFLNKESLILENKELIAENQQLIMQNKKLINEY